MYNTNHDYVEFNEQITLETVNSIRTLDEPFADPSYVPTYLLRIYQINTRLLYLEMVMSS